MAELKLGRRIIRAVLVFVLFALVVTLAPVLNISPRVTRMAALILLALVFITPFLPARASREARIYLLLLGLVFCGLVATVVWARFW